MGILHKYVRRLVVWVQTPSEEEKQAFSEHQRACRERYESRTIKAGDLRPVSILSDELHEHDPIKAGAFIETLKQGKKT